MSQSESRGCSTSSAGAVEQDMCLTSLVSLDDGLCRIIEQQANEIVKLQNKIRVLKQELAFAKSELQGKESHSHDQHTAT